MRTSAGRGKPAASRRVGRAAAPVKKTQSRQPETRSSAAARAQSAENDVQPVAVTAVRMLAVGEGLYALRVSEIGGASGTLSGVEFPIAQVSAPFAEDGESLEIVASFPRRGSWLGREGGTVIIRSPAGGGHIIVTAYGHAEQPAVHLTLELRRLDRPAAGAAVERGAAGPALAASEPAAEGDAREVPTEILLHIERAGDRLFPGRGWVGALGRKLRIEAFSIRPLERSRRANRIHGLSPARRRNAVGSGRIVMRHARPPPALDRFRGTARAAPRQPVRRRLSGLVLFGRDLGAGT